MGQPTMLKTWYHAFGRGGKRGELKHLSSRRKRKQVSDSVSSGERTRNSPNRSCYGTAGVVGPGIKPAGEKSNALGKAATDGESPVDVNELVGWDS